jgi:hypothetical protein
MTDKKVYTQAETEIIELDLSIITENSEIRVPEIED